MLFKWPHLLSDIDIKIWVQLLVFESLKNVEFDYTWQIL